MVPLAVTLATDAVFDSFSGDSKLKALLHGHSYSAHAMGCATAAKAIQWFKDPETNHNITSQGKTLREVLVQLNMLFIFIVYASPDS
jgi:dethiobiotin synthetase/adenosylmethionine--8-amino-7-oxononanoate aminotransferase